MNAENASVGDLTGRVVVITGASSGVGLAAAEALARSGDRVALVGRDPARLQAAVERVRDAGRGRTPPAYRADFTRLDDVHLLGDQLRDAYPTIDVLANNAGGVVSRRRLTADGYESTLQANHLSPFLLTLLLRDRLRGGRVINTASDAHRSGRIDPDDFKGGRPSYRMLQVYGASKQANILFTLEATRRWPDILSTCFHPGVVRSRFGSGSAIGVFFKTAPFLKTPEQGADTLVWLANAGAPELTPGGYYVKRRLQAPAPTASDPVLAARLWEASLAAVGA